MNTYTCPICGQEHLHTSAKMVEIVFDFLKMPPQGGNRKQTSLGPKTRCGLMSAYDCVQGPSKEAGAAGGEKFPKDVPALWKEAFEAFKKASDATHVNVLPGHCFDRAASMYSNFEHILAQFHENHA